jgi:hypothetical protein
MEYRREDQDDGRRVHDVAREQQHDVDAQRNAVVPSSLARIQSPIAWDVSWDMRSENSTALV